MLQATLSGGAPTLPFGPVPSTPTAVLGDDLIRVVKLLHHVRQQAPRQHPQVDPMAYPLLFNLKAGPLRVSALAEAVHSDVSTVSRQVSTLVDLGFVTRGPDPDDGRAQALSLTDEGDALLTAIRRTATAGSRACSPTGPDDDVASFSAHLRHFASDLEASLPPHPKDRPMTDSTPPAPPGTCRRHPAAAPAAAVGEPDRPTGPLNHRQIVTILIGLMMGMFLAALDQTIVATAIRTIADDLKGLNHQAWATTAYLITSTIVTPLYGKLGDIYGRKKLFIIAISIFIFGSVLCAFATSMGTLAIYRAVQGLGAGGLFSLALAIIGDIVPPRERAKYQGYFLAVFGTASVLGPVIGGFFAGQQTILGIDGWRWVFLVNVPVGPPPGRRLQDPPPAPHPPGPPHRLARRCPALRRPRAAPPRRGAGPRVGLDVGVVHDLLRRRRARGDRLLLAGVADEGGGDPPARDVPQQDGRCLLGRLGAHRCGDVRWSRGAAALPPDRQGRDAHRGRPAPPADDPRHHGRLDPVGSDHLPHRPLPDVPHHRLGPARACRSSSSTTSSTTRRCGRR